VQNFTGEIFALIERPGAMGPLHAAPSAASVRILEGHAQLRAEGFDLAILDYEVLVDNFGDAQITQRLARAFDRGLGRIFPGLFTGADDFNDLVDAFGHCTLLGFLNARRA
jgi:hypothetical protein